MSVAKQHNRYGSLSEAMPANRNLPPSTSRSGSYYAVDAQADPLFGAPADEGEFDDEADSAIQQITVSAKAYKLAGIALVIALISFTIQTVRFLDVEL